MRIHQVSSPSRILGLVPDYIIARFKAGENSVNIPKNVFIPIINHLCFFLEGSHWQLLISLLFFRFKNIRLEGFARAIRTCARGERGLILCRPLVSRSNWKLARFIARDAQRQWETARKPSLDAQQFKTKTLLLIDAKLLNREKT